MEIVLKITQELPIKTGVSQNGKGWELASFVGETQERYPRKVCFEIFGEDRIKNNPCKVDDLVTVFFDIESREYNGKWFTSVRAWKIEQGVTTVPAAKQENTTGQPAIYPDAQQKQQEQQAVQYSDEAAIEGNGDLPF